MCVGGCTRVWEACESDGNPMYQVLREATEKPYLDINQPALRAAIYAAESAGTDGSGSVLT